MYIAICDDQHSELEEIEKILDTWQRERNISIKYKRFSNAADMLDAAKRERFTLYLLDVVMAGTDGLSAAREIRELDKTVDIVFITSALEFAYESYGVKAFDYLLKPVKSETLFALLDTINLREQKPDEGLTIKCGSVFVRILFSQLTYVEVNGKHLYFNLTDGSVRKIFGTLNEYAPLLIERPEFVMIHRSYIVNMFQIAELSAGEVTTFTGERLPVSRRLYPKIKKEYMDLLFKRNDYDLL